MTYADLYPFVTPLLLISFYGLVQIGRDIL